MRGYICGKVHNCEAFLAGAAILYMPAANAISKRLCSRSLIADKNLSEVSEPLRGSDVAVGRLAGLIWQHACFLSRFECDYVSSMLSRRCKRRRAVISGQR